MRFHVFIYLHICFKRALMLAAAITAAKIQLFPEKRKKGWGRVGGDCFYPRNTRWTRKILGTDCFVFISTEHTEDTEIIILDAVFFQVTG